MENNMQIREMKAWLSRAIEIDSEIDVLIAARDIAWNRCVSITSSLKERVKSSGEENDSKILKYVEFTEKIDKAINDLIIVKEEVLEKIQTLPQGNLRQVLILRYINFYNWEKIANTLGYSYVQVCRLHKKALELLIKGQTKE